MADGIVFPTFYLLAFVERERRAQSQFDLRTRDIRDTVRIWRFQYSDLLGRPLRIGFQGSVLSGSVLKRNPKTKRLVTTIATNLYELVGRVGIEPTTNGSRVRKWTVF